jgi:uncharacterized HAD superfamily protein
MKNKPIPYKLMPLACTESKKKVIGVDVDGCLTEETCWTEGEMQNATPRLDVIEAVNKMAKQNFIVIHTARRECFYQATVEWLKKHNVTYHAVSMGKLPCDLYIDDRAINVEEL